MNSIFNKWGGVAVRVLKQVLPIRTKWPHWFFRLATMRNYKLYHGYTFDLDNPKTFTEKILWYMTEYDCTEISKITDKVLFKQYIERKLGKGFTLEMYNHWDSVSDFERDWESLPTSVVLKANLQGKGNCIRVIEDKSAVDFNEIKAEVASWLKPRNTYLDNFACRMFNSKPQVLAEKFEPKLGLLTDYKIFCFDGEPYCVYVANNKPTLDVDSTITFYDLDWNKIDASLESHPTGEGDKPTHFNQMLEYSRVLSKGFPFVRVDFFDTDEALYLSEMTFCPSGACSKYTPQSFNEELGKKFKLPTD